MVRTLRVLYEPLNTFLLQVGAVNVLTCQQAADVPGFTVGTVITVEVCCVPPQPVMPACGSATYPSVTSLLYFGAGSTCTDVSVQLNDGTGCGFHCYSVRLH
jgi:hypothetical protein